MMMTSAELEKKFNLDRGYVNYAFIHEKCKTYFIEGHVRPYYEEKDAVEVLRAYHKYQERLALENLSMWKDRADRFEATLIELEGLK